MQVFTFPTARGKAGFTNWIVPMVEWCILVTKSVTQTVSPMQQSDHLDGKCKEKIIPVY